MVTVGPLIVHIGGPISALATTRVLDVQAELPLT
jgi:hypothetical protein